MALLVVRDVFNHAFDSQRQIRMETVVMTRQDDIPRDPEDRIIDEQSEQDVREKMLDKTIADTFPASDPPSSFYSQSHWRFF